MPIDTSLRSRMAASLPACQRRGGGAGCTRPSANAPCCARCGSATSRASCSTRRRPILGAALDAGLDPTALARWMVGKDTIATVQEDKARARAPHPAALVLDDRLAGW